MSHHREPETMGPEPPASAANLPDEAMLAEINPGRREFVKRLLITTGATVAMMTSLSIPEVMAKGGRSPGAGT